MQLLLTSCLFADKCMWEITECIVPLPGERVQSCTLHLIILSSYWSPLVPHGVGDRPSVIPQEQARCGILRLYKQNWHTFYVNIAEYKRKVQYTAVAHSNQSHYHTGRKFSLEFKICYFAHGKSAKLKFRLFLYFRNLSIIAYIIEIQKTKIRSY